MNKLLIAVIGLVLLGSAPIAAAQTATPAPTVPEVETEAPTVPPTEAPAPQTEDPVAPVAPVDTVDDDDDDGFSTTAIALIILAAVVLLLLIYALAWGPWRRPGDPRPRA